ncbi:hypothetical protein [Streptomyces noursei]|uniref:hypothetical protein n=1 Tax=Streptomyces noursei TaxID=1971 RepID=UPI0023B85EBB|nr:hypothetical protein [Streptomyces noursei]
MTATSRPAVGDLVLEVVTDVRWVRTDIAGATSEQPVWLLRPLYGSWGEAYKRVDHRDIAAYRVESRRGEWGQQ